MDDIAYTRNTVATALGFATTLVSASFPMAECKRYVAIYAAAQPLAALFSYSATMLSGIVPSKRRSITIVMNSFTVSPTVFLLPSKLLLIVLSEWHVRLCRAHSESFDYRLSNDRQEWPARKSASHDSWCFDALRSAYDRIGLQYNEIQKARW